MEFVSFKNLLSNITLVELNILLSVVISLFAVATIIFFKIPFKIWNFLKNSFSWFKVWIRRDKPTIPKETLKIVFKDRLNWWCDGSVDNKPARQLSVKCSVTNITDFPITIIDSKVDQTVKSGNHFVKLPDDVMFDNKAIPAKTTAELSGIYFINPTIFKRNVNFKTKLILIDQFGNKHKSKKITFICRNRNRQDKNLIAKESLHEISNKLIKDIVSVLKNECKRYENCGRRTGGLGSVITSISNKTFNGVGSDNWTSNTTVEYLIHTGTNSNVINSENAQAIVTAYNKLEKEQEKEMVINALVSRLSKNSEYSSVSYLILLVLFRIGKLSTALSKAMSLEGDSEHGFSDFLMLLSALLKYEHSLFLDDDLDRIEKFVEKTTEYSFYTKERIASIRAARLRKSMNS